MGRANNVRDTANPFEATLGTPNARGRIDALYPDNPGTANLFRTRDLEQQLQRTSNDVLGNSRTAQRTIADDAFASSPWLEGALHAGAAAATHGASISGTAARIAGSGLKDRIAMGFGKRAEARADAMAPVLFNADPSMSLDQIAQYQAQQQAYADLVARTTPKRVLGMFGRSAGSQATVAPFNY